MRELDERLGLSELMDRHLNDSRRGKNIQLLLADLLRQSIYSRLAGYEDVKRCRAPPQDPTFRLIGSRKIWERGAALTSRLQSFETEVLTQEGNLAGLAALPPNIGPGPGGKSHCLHYSAGGGYEWLNSRRQKGNSR